MRSHTYPILYHLVRMTDPLSSETSDQYSIRPSDMSIKEKDADNVVKKNNGMFTIAFSRLLGCSWTQTFIIVQEKRFLS